MKVADKRTNFLIEIRHLYCNKYYHRDIYRDIYTDIL
jgi:hypothetical protein